MKNENLGTFSYAKLISELIKFSHLHKFNIKLIGYENFKNIKAVYPLYRFTINHGAKIKFGIVTGMHGDEVAGPLSMYLLFQKPKKYFNEKICYYIYPVISPTAFDLRRRYDDDNVELNTLNKKTLRNYKYHEIKEFYNDVKDKKFNAFISFHEDVDQKKFYAYTSKEYNKVYQKIINNAKKNCGILKKKIIDKKESNGKGFILGGHDQTIEDWVCFHKNPAFHITTETPGKIDLEKRIATNLNNIKLVNNYLLKNNL
ncbi:MAG: hypothetical protein ABIA02_03530 [Candidatus Falkowbacteria bacterium]